MLLTNDGRIFVGILHGFDSSTNITLITAHERIYSREAGVGVKQLGCQIIRGDMLYISYYILCIIIRAIVGLIDESVEETIDYENTRANPIPPIMH